jgi:hypothetical protein
VAVPLCWVILTSGCITTGNLFSSKEELPKGPVCQVVATWHNEVVTTPDPVHNGNPTPGIAGRLYLFGPTVDFSKVGDGSVVVDLFDETHATPEQPAKLLEEWQIDKVTLQRLLRRDIIGWGYTLFLPWATCKPEITKVHLKLRYEPASGGAPIYAESAPMTLTHDPSIAVAVAGRNPSRPEEFPKQAALPNVGNTVVPAGGVQLPGHSN